MRIFLINHYAGSPELGMEFRPYYLAQKWQKMGHEVTIAASDKSHVRNRQPEIKKDFEEQIIDGICYLWIKTIPYKKNSAKRLFNMLSFIWKLFLKASKISEKYKPDVVIASSTYPLDNYVANKIAKKAKAKYIYEVHDLWPLSPIELGGFSKYHPFIALMQHAENYAYRKADLVVSMLPKTSDYMKSHGLDLKKWYHIPNGILIDEWHNKCELNGHTRDKLLSLKSKYSSLVGYTGAFGVANALDALVLAGEMLNETSTAIVILGNGPEKVNLEKLINTRNISNVYLLSSVNKNEIPSLLEYFDFLYIGLQKQNLFRFGISPNKLIDYMMSGKPIIQAIDAGNNIVKEVGCGISIEPENPIEIANGIRALKHLSKEELEEMGLRGQKFVLKNHDYKILAERFIEILK